MDNDHTFSTESWRDDGKVREALVDDDIGEGWRACPGRIVATEIIRASMESGASVVLTRSSLPRELVRWCGCLVEQENGCPEFIKHT